MSNKIFYKVDKTDKVWQVSTPGKEGPIEFSFDKKTVFNLFLDYPNALTPEQKKIFDEENPELARLVSDREYNPPKEG